MKAKLALSIIGLVLASLVAGCIGGGTQTQTQTQGKSIKVAILFDVGGRGDLSFNDMAYLGAERAKKSWESK